MKFLIQTINKKIVHDFSFTLLESIRFNNWANQSEEIKFKLSDVPKYIKNYIPIGSVEFVSQYLLDNYDVKIKPINIPEELLDVKFTGRCVFNGTEKDIILGEKKFIKSNDKIKTFTEITDNTPIGHYQISDIIKIKSEWRAFVFKSKLVGLQNYSGDFTAFPNIEKINNMIVEYKSQPIAFTLDVAIKEDDNDTVVIECHNFFSCGLYGFADHNILPYMFSQSFYEILRKNSKNLT
jgi:hypothetical protein